jgi:hypothetical protein
MSTGISMSRTFQKYCSKVIFHRQLYHYTTILRHWYLNHYCSSHLHLLLPALLPYIPKYQQACTSITSKKYCSKVIFQCQPSAAPGPPCYLWCGGYCSELNLHPRLLCDSFTPSMPVLYLYHQSSAPCLLVL